MLNFQDFFAACAGFWKTERTYHAMLEGEIERSYTEFRAEMLEFSEKQRILSAVTPDDHSFDGIKIDTDRILSAPLAMPGFAISFDTRSETGEEVSMSLKALFVPDAYVLTQPEAFRPLPLPVAAQVPAAPDEEVIQGFYLRDRGYSEAGAIAGRFTYQATRQTLEMTTYYKQSVAVDQMRFITPQLRLRTIITYQRPADDSLPSVVELVGFGVERKDSA